MFQESIYIAGARFSSVVERPLRCRTSAHGAMDHWIDPLYWNYWANSRCSQCSSIGMTKAGVCISLSVDPLLLFRNSNPWCGGSRFHLSLSDWSFNIIMLDAIKP